MEKTYCNSCNQELTDRKDRQPCPNCGSMSRNFQIDIQDTIEIHDLLNLKHKVPASNFKNKIAYESKIGSDYSRDKKRMVNLVQVIDRENDVYIKKITDPLTNEITRDVHEPLTKHTGRGSAKPKNSNPN